MRFPTALLLLPLSLARADDEAERALVEWIRSLGGYVNPSQVIRREKPDDPSSLRGVFASADIATNDLLLDLPMATIIASDPERTDVSISEQCASVWALKRELELGDKSSFAPYVRLLNYDVSLPDSFTEAGKNMLRKVAGPYLEPQNIGTHVAWWFQWCKGDPKDPLGVNAALLSVSRSCNNKDVAGIDRSLMVPYYDLYNHRNGKWHNTRIHATWGKGFKVYASKDIRAGEQIYNSYGSGVPEILSHYGFVEELPQQWSFEIPARDKTAHKIAFVIDANEEGNLSFTFLKGAEPTADDAAFLKFYEKNRLNSIEKEILFEDAASCPADIPEHEMEVISQYYRALKRAIDSAALVAEQKTAGRKEH